MGVRFLVNPSAGKNKTRKVWRKMFAGKGFDVRICEQKGMLDTYTREAVNEGVNRLVVVGGDGSLNTVINALDGADVEIGVIPTGSGNDFVRTAGVRKVDPERYLGQCNLRRIDLGNVEGRLFVNIFGSGFDADVARGMQLSSLQGDLGYLASVLRILKVFRSPVVKIETDRESMELATMTVSVGNGRYHGGMFMLTPFANLTDGELDLCLVRKIPRLRLLVLIPTSLNGKHVEVRDVVSMHRFRRMKLTFSHPVYYHVDGEVSVAPRSEIEISILPEALTVVMP